MAAGLVAAFVAGRLLGMSGTPMEIKNVPAALVAELLFTFARVYVLLSTATAKEATLEPAAPATSPRART